MKINADTPLMPQDPLKAVQDKIHALKMTANQEGDQTRIRYRAMAENSAEEVAPFEHLAQIQRSSRSGVSLGDVHGNLDMDRVRQLLSPVG